MAGYSAQLPPTAKFLASTASHFFLQFSCTILYNINKWALGPQVRVRRAKTRAEGTKCPPQGLGLESRSAEKFQAQSSPALSCLVFVRGALSHGVMGDISLSTLFNQMLNLQDVSNSTCLIEMLRQWDANR